MYGKLFVIDSFAWFIDFLWFDLLIFSGLIHWFSPVWFIDFLQFECKEWQTALNILDMVENQSYLPSFSKHNLTESLYDPSNNKEVRGKLYIEMYYNTWKDGTFKCLANIHVNIGYWILFKKILFSEVMWGRI